MSVRITPYIVRFLGADLAEQVGEQGTDREWMIEATAHESAHTAIDETVVIDFGFALKDEELSTIKHIIAPVVYPKNATLDVEGTVVTISSQSND